jgi:hypothetical protein
MFAHAAIRAYGTAVQARVAVRSAVTVPAALWRFTWFLLYRGLPGSRAS